MQDPHLNRIFLKFAIVKFPSQLGRGGKFLMYLSGNNARGGNFFVSFMKTTAIRNFLQLLKTPPFRDPSPKVRKLLIWWF